MKHECSNDAIKEQAALYALGVMTQLESRAFESHIRDGCEVCRAKLSEFERAAGIFALNAPQIKPPVYLIDLLLARIEKETAERPVEPEPSQDAAGFLSSTYRRIKAAVSADGLRRLAARATPWIVAALLGAVGIVLFAALSSARSANANQDQAIIQLKNDIQQMNRLAESAANKSRELAQIVSVLETPGARQVQLAGQGAALSSKVALFQDPRSGFSIISADQLPVAEGLAYQVWFVTSDGPRSAGILQTDSAGHGFLATSAAVNFPEITAASITLEPEGGSSQPTGQVMALGKLFPATAPHTGRGSARPKA